MSPHRLIVDDDLTVRNSPADNRDRDGVRVSTGRAPGKELIARASRRQGLVELEDFVAVA